MAAAQQFTSREMLAKLVSFDTTSHRSNLALIDWVRHYLAGYGVSAHITNNDDGSKANLYATLGPVDGGGICLHGHTDVVPVDGQQWHTDPFTLHEADGRLYGRGTCDMKGFLACALAAVPMFLRQRLKTPIHLALSYDEEVGCLGAPRMIQAFGRQVARPAIAVVGEPTLMQPVVAHKGMLALVTEFRGQPAHSSVPQHGASAIEAAAEMVSELTEFGRTLRRMRYPYDMDPSGPSINVGMLDGGTARNIVAEHATLLWELRFRDLDNAEELLATVEMRVAERLRRVLGTDAGKITWHTRQVARFPAFAAAEDSRATALARAFGAVGAATAVPYGAEAGQYADAGVDTLLCGPGSIEQAHKANEFVAVGQMEACNRFMGRLGDWAQHHTLADAAALA